MYPFFLFCIFSLFLSTFSFRFVSFPYSRVPVPCLSTCIFSFFCVHFPGSCLFSLFMDVGEELHTVSTSECHVLDPHCISIIALCMMKVKRSTNWKLLISPKHTTNPGKCKNVMISKNSLHQCCCSRRDPQRLICVIFFLFLCVIFFFLITRITLHSLQGVDSANRHFVLPKKEKYTIGLWIHIATWVRPVYVESEKFGLCIHGFTGPRKYPNSFTFTSLVREDTPFLLTALDSAMIVK